MVTSCNLAFTHRSRHTVSFQGQMHLLNALIVCRPPSHWDMFRTRDVLVPSLLAQYSQGEEGMNLSLDSGAKLGRRGEESKFMEGESQVWLLLKLTFVHLDPVTRGQ